MNSFNLKFLKHWINWTLALVLVGFFGGPLDSVWADPFRYPVQGPESIQYFSNVDPAFSSSEVKTLVFAIQGHKRQPKVLFDGFYSILQKEGRLSDTVLFVPWFKGDEDTIEAGEASWTSQGWKIGDVSKGKSKISSFSVVDQMITSVIESKRFPSLKRVVVTGHSAGGQFSQRYAFGTLVDQKYKSIEFEFIIANPSSYLYLNSDRPDWAGMYSKERKFPEFGLGAESPLIPNFMDPYDRSVLPRIKKDVFASIKNQNSEKECRCAKDPCPYERFKYGFDLKPKNPFHYMCFEKAKQKCDAGISVDVQIARFLKKKVTYVIGQLDSLDHAEANEDLDISCSGNMQGRDRLARSTYYYESLNQWNREFGAHAHRLLIAPQVGHNASELYGTYIGKRALFGGDLPVKEYLAPAMVLKPKDRKPDVGNENPTYIVTKIKDQEYTLQVETSRLYLEETLSNGVIAPSEYKSSDTQRWIVTPVAGEKNTYIIKNKASNKYMADPISTSRPFKWTFENP